MQDVFNVSLMELMYSGEIGLHNSTLHKATLFIVLAHLVFPFLVQFGTHKVIFQHFKNIIGPWFHAQKGGFSF